jgi:hypothetical protein
LFEGYIHICKQSTAAQPKKEPEKVEVFVDGKAIHVEPNTTVLQVIQIKFCFRLQLKNNR